MILNFRLVKDSIIDFVYILNYFWSFGATAGIYLVIQILTGIFLGMHYVPHVDFAFHSVTMFFFRVFPHIFPSKSRQVLWITGVIIFLLMMVTAFMGYVLPWGQMSFWGATVITNLFSVVPVVGGSIIEWLWGGFSVSNATLNRFFSLHYLMPFFSAGLAILHLSILHGLWVNNLQSNTNIYTKTFFYPFLFSFLLIIFLILFWKNYGAFIIQILLRFVLLHPGLRSTSFTSMSDSSEDNPLNLKVEDVPVDVPVADFASYFPFVMYAVAFSLRKSVYLVMDPSGTLFLVIVVAPLVGYMLLG